MSRDPGRQIFSALIFEYRSDQGEIIDIERCDGQFRIWHISEDKFDFLRTINKGRPILNDGPDAPQFDLKILCKEAKFQDLSMFPVPCHYKSKPAWYQSTQEVLTVLTRHQTKMLGHRLTETELMAHFGLLPSTKKVVTRNEVDFNDVVDGLELTSTPSSKENSSLEAELRSQASDIEHSGPQAHPRSRR